MPAVKIKTATGWKDVAYRGPQGMPGARGLIGDAGPPGPTNMVPLPDDMKVSYKAPGTGGQDGYVTQAYELWGASAGDLRQYITPTYSGSGVGGVWWEVECYTIVQCVDGTWNRMDFQWWNDLGGANSGVPVTARQPQYIQSMANIGWQTISCRATFRCQSGISYALRPVLMPSSGSWLIYHAAEYTWSMGKVTGYWETQGP